MARSFFRLSRARLMFLRVISSHAIFSFRFILKLYLEWQFLWHRFTHLESYKHAEVTKENHWLWSNKKNGSAQRFSLRIQLENQNERKNEFEMA